jgi:hypothetical protein
MQNIKKLYTKNKLLTGEQKTLLIGTGAIAATEHVFRNPQNPQQSALIKTEEILYCTYSRYSRYGLRYTQSIFPQKTHFFTNILRRSLPLFSQKTLDTCYMCMRNAVQLKYFSSLNFSDKNFWKFFC